VQILLTRLPYLPCYTPAVRRTHDHSSTITGPRFRPLEDAIVALPDRFSRATRFVAASVLYVVGFLLCFAVAAWWQEGKIRTATIGVVIGLAAFGVGNIVRPPRILRLQPTTSALAQRIAQIGLMILVIVLILLGLLLKISSFSARTRGRSEVSTVTGLLSVLLLFVAASLRPRPLSRDRELLDQLFAPVTFPLSPAHLALLAQGAARTRRTQTRLTALSFALFVVTQVYSIGLISRVSFHERAIAFAIALASGILIFGMLLRYRLNVQAQLLAADWRDGVALRITAPVVVTRRWYVNFLSIADQRFTLDAHTAQRLAYLRWGTVDFAPYTHHLLAVWDANARPIYWPAGPSPDPSLTPVPT
jgi:hypothetical protein